MDDSDQFKLGVLLPLIVAFIGVFGLVLGFAQSHQPALLILAAVAVFVIALYLAASPRRNRWKGFVAPPGARFEPVAAELPLVADHRDVFGPGRIENVVTDTAYTAFETVRGGERTWWFVVELADDWGVGHAHVPSYTNGTGVRGHQPLFERYDLSGNVPGPMRQVLDAADERVDVRVEHRLLIATSRGMSGHAFPGWLRHQGAIVERIAAALGRARTPEPSAPPALEAPSSDSSRNQWRPEERMPQPEQWPRP